MVVLLPAAGRFEEIRDQVTASWLNEVLATSSERVTAALTFPRFRLSWGPASVVGPLQSLGLTETFTPNADLSGISADPDLWVYDVVHGAFVDVDERGTAAVAVTVVGGGNIVLAVPEPRRVTFTVDRPCIPPSSDASGAILFAGQLVDPSLGGSWGPDGAVGPRLVGEPRGAREPLSQRAESPGFWERVARPVAGQHQCWWFDPLSGTARRHLEVLLPRGSMI